MAVSYLAAVTVSVLGNDLAGPEPLQVSSVTIVSAPSNGAVTINPVDGSIQHTPKMGI